MFTNTHQLNAIQLNDLEELRSICVKNDTNVPNVYAHILSQARTLPAAILAYKKGKLFGFLSVFFFYDEAVEISLLVAPTERRKGWAKKLLHSILPLIRSYQFPNLIFSSPSGLNNTWLAPLGFTFLHTEYHMLRKNINPLLHHEPSLVIRNLHDSDLPALIKLDEECFAKKQYESQERFSHLIHDKTYQIFVMLQNDTPIAKAHLRWEGDGASLSDIAVTPSLQGKGFGTALIAHCINFALAEGRSTISLDVETKNVRALHLYTRLGFIIKNSCDYWRIGLDDLEKVIHP